MFPICQYCSFEFFIKKITKNIYPFPKCVPVPPILYAYTREKYIYHFLARVCFSIYKCIKNVGNEGERGTLKAETYPFLLFALFQVRSNCF